MEFTRERVVKLLSKLYNALCEEENKLMKADVPDKWWERLGKSLYSVSETRKGEAKENYSEQECKLVGPNGERPIHVCFLRAGHFPELIGFKEGVLQGIQQYVDRAAPDRQREIDEPYGKDYCAAVGYAMHQRRVQNPAAHDDELLLEILVDGGAQADVPPYWYDLQQWLRASESLSQRLWRADAVDLGFEKQLEAEDLIMLTTCGLYEGETPMLMAIADRNVKMVKWILDRYGAR
jgi:hypothetical protein